MNEMTSHWDAIEELGGCAELYRQLVALAAENALRNVTVPKIRTISLSGVEHWSKRGRIPHWWWDSVAAVAVRKGNARITYELLKRLDTERAYRSMKAAA